MLCRSSLLCLVSILPACAGDPGQDATATRPNVLMIVVDTLRRDHLGCYGYERDTSPHIDRFAATAVRYDRAYSQAPWTTASIGSLMTSLYPSQLGIESDRSVLHSDQVLLAEVLAANGYATGAAISHTFCSSEWNFSQGFELFDESSILGHRKLSSPGVTQVGIEYLEQHKDEPFFLWLHYFDPHFAYNEHSEYAFGDGGAYDGPVEPGMLFSKLNKLRRSLDDADVAQLIGFYDSEVRYTDDHLGRVLAKLDELGLTEDTLVVFTADHGEEFMDHGRLGHAKTLYSEVVHVPLIVRYPGGAPGVVTGPVGLVDVFPTVLEVLGITTELALAGSSLQPGADGSITSRPVFTENARGNPQRATIVGTYKLVEHIREGRFELYDIVADPAESNDLYGELEHPTDELKLQLADWAEMLARTDVKRQAIELTETLSESLEAMGYAGDDE